MLTTSVINVAKQNISVYFLKLSRVTKVTQEKVVHVFNGLFVSSGNSHVRNQDSGQNFRTSYWLKFIILQKILKIIDEEKLNMIHRGIAFLLVLISRYESLNLYFFKLNTLGYVCYNTLIFQINARP